MGTYQQMEVAEQPTLTWLWNWCSWKPVGLWHLASLEISVSEQWRGRKCSCYRCPRHKVTSHTGRRVQVRKEKKAFSLFNNIWSNIQWRLCFSYMWSHTVLSLSVGFRQKLFIIDIIFIKLFIYADDMALVGLLHRNDDVSDYCACFQARTVVWVQLIASWCWENKRTYYKSSWPTHITDTVWPKCFKYLGTHTL